MSRFMPLAGAAAVVAVAVGAFAIAMPRPSGVISVPAVTPAASTPSPSPFISTVDWLPFSSTRYGYESAYPPDWTARQSVRAWSIDTTRTHGTARRPTSSTGGSVLVTAFAADVPPGDIRRCVDLVLPHAGTRRLGIVSAVHAHADHACDDAG